MIKNLDGATTDGLAAALELAFDIAEAQLETNPASISLRGLDREGRELRQRVIAIKGDAEILEREEKLLRRQATSHGESGVLGRIPATCGCAAGAVAQRTV